MSTKTENNQFYRGRKDILGEFEVSHRTLMSGVAGRNFSKAPGFLLEASIMLEEAGKSKLSALNFQIVSEAVERELKQTGHDYTQTYKAARIAFELEKQTLLTALQNEFADVDATQSLKEEELNRLFVELDIRKLILIITKTAIELEMEALKQELVGVDRLTFINEESLINEKVATATAKLAVIPYLEELIVSQGKILTAEKANIPYMEVLIGQKELLINKKIELVPYLEDKSVTLTELAGAILAAIGIEEDRLGVALSTAETKMDRVDNTLDVIAAEKAIEALRALLYTAKYNLQITEIDRRIALTNSNSTNINEISAEYTSMMTVLEAYKTEIASADRNSRGIVSGIDLASDEATVNTSVTANTQSTKTVAAYGASATKETAIAAATAKITSELIHLIGS